MSAAGRASRSSTTAWATCARSRRRSSAPARGRTITSDHDAIRAADGAVLPGVGAFPKAMRNLRELELDVLIGELLAGGMPMLGICLGMQLLFEASSENEGGWGLGLLSGTGRAAAGARAEGPAHRLERRALDAAHRAHRGPARTSARSTSCTRSRRSRVSEDDVLGTSSYGEPFVCAVEREPVYGVQFHPEKSSVHGLQLLRNFTSICAAVGATP